jgi:hypothetical protein
VTEEVVVEGVDSVLAVVGHGGGERGCWLGLAGGTSRRFPTAHEVHEFFLISKRSSR